MEKPEEPSGPFGALTTVKRGALSSMELILMREIKRSGRGDTSRIFTTPHADVFPVRCNNSQLDIFFTLNKINLHD